MIRTKKGIVVSAKQEKTLVVAVHTYEKSSKVQKKI